MEDSANAQEPSQRLLARLMDVYGIEAEEYSELFPRTLAQQDRDREHQEQHADLSRRVAAVDSEGWIPGSHPEVDRGRQ